MRILVAENDVPLADFLCQKLETEQLSVELTPGTSEAENLVTERSCRPRAARSCVALYGGHRRTAPYSARESPNCPSFFSLHSSVWTNVPGAWTQVRMTWCPNQSRRPCDGPPESQRSSLGTCISPGKSMQGTTGRSFEPSAARVIKSAPAKWFRSRTHKLISSSARDSATDAKEKAPQNGRFFCS